jgi:hypothetical protein
VTFIGADVDVETGAKGGALLGSQYVRAESFKWRAAAPALAVSLVQRFNASQLSGYLQAGRGARVAVLSSTADAAGYTLAELLHASVPLLVVNAGAYTQQHAQMASYGALRRRWEVQAKCRTHRPQKLKCLISLCTNPVSILSVPIQTVR